MHSQFTSASGRTHDVIGAAIEVHQDKGPGLLESIYEWCFTKELELRDHSIPAECPGRDSNPHSRIWPGDFKSPVSANSTTWAGALPAWSDPDCDRFARCSASPLLMTPPSRPATRQQDDNRGKQWTSKQSTSKQSTRGATYEVVAMDRDCIDLPSDRVWSSVFKPDLTFRWTLP